MLSNQIGTLVLSTAIPVTPLFHRAGTFLRHAIGMYM